MPLVIITQESEGVERRSSPMFCVEQALTSACRLIKEGVTVVRIEGFGEEVPAKEIREWAAGRRRVVR